MVAVSQAPSSEIEVSERPSAETWRTSRRNWGNWPSSRRRRARSAVRSRVAAGSSILKTSRWLWIASGFSCAPAGGGEPPMQAVASRQTARRARRSTGGETGLRRPAGRTICRRPCCRDPPCRRRRGRAATATCGPHVLGIVFVEQRGELLHHRAAQLVGIDNGDGTAVVARDVVADADGDQLDRRARLDPVDDVAQMALEIVARIDRQGRNRRPARRRRSPS